MEDTLGREFIGALFKLKSLLSATMGRDGFQAKRNINMPEYILLRRVAEQAKGQDANTCLAEIRDYLAVSKPAISQMLTALEKKGYIVRKINPENRRRLIVTLTPPGRECLAEIDGVYDARFAQLVGGMGEQDIREMIRLIRCMSDTIGRMNMDLEEQK